MFKDTLQERAIEVIKPLIPPDAEERVCRSFRQWNQIVRDHIRNETALKLADGDGRLSIPVKIVDGFPETLARLINEYDDPVLWRLVVGQPKLGGIVEGLRFLLECWHDIDRWPSLPPIAKDGERHLIRSLKITNALQEVAVARQVRNELKRIREDILGVYRFVLGIGSRIELYWMPISMVSAMLDVRIEDLTVVVLAHELAHGYTHVGRDIDGIQWDDRGFGSSDPRVVEGLAQFYTEVVTEKIAARTPGPKIAYERFLRLQRGPHLAHRTWLRSDPKQRGETIRFTMVQARNRGAVTYDIWTNVLNRTTGNLKERETQKNLFNELDGKSHSIPH